ncbi:site-specific integrase [Paenibacillus filicis]|uniref:Site-specific integrase n=1 Tax=Paenibacillus filicis TaxID=669464 RepID=A0ABU9DVN7_9BACL
MASFQKYNTKNGPMWMYKYYLPTIDPKTGKKKQSTKRGFRTKKEASLDAAKTEQEIANGTFVIEDRFMTFKQLFEQWFATISTTYKPPTKKSVMSKFNKRILPHFGHLKLKDITKSYCQDVLNAWHKEIKSVENMRMYASLIFEHAIKMEILSKNPMKDTILPKSEEDFFADDTDKRNYWEKHEIKQFLEAAENEFSLRDYVIFHTLIYTGARKGEVLALRWNDIDFKNKTMSLSKTLFQENRQSLSLTSKTADSKRVISLDDTSINWLKKLRTEASKGTVVSLDGQANSLVFARKDGEGIRLAHPNRKLQKLIEKLNLHSITVHGLRHTHASLLFEAGANIKEVQERLGHSDIKMTMNIYTHVTKAVKEKTADRFEKFMQQ